MLSMYRAQITLTLLVLLFCCSTAPAQRWRVLTPTLSHTIMINPLDATKLYVGNWTNQMFRSDDRGLSWRTVELGDLNVINYLTSTVVTQADTGVILAGGFWFDGIRRSSDGGASWQRVLTDTINNARMWFISEAIIEDPTRPGLLYAARGSTYNGIWRSSDNGLTWDSIGTISRQLTGRLCTMAMRSDSTNILFVGATGGQIFRSDDSGRTWRNVPVNNAALTIRSDSEIPKIVFSPGDPSVGYAVVTIVIEQNIKGNGGLLRTTDGGASWNRIAFPDTSLWAVDVRSRNGRDEIFVGGFRIPNTDTVIKGDGLLFRSSDGGTSWERFTDVPWGVNENGDSIRNVWVIRCDPTSDRVYVAAATGLYALDEPTSVPTDETTDARPALVSDVRNEFIEVTTSNWPAQQTSWRLVDLRGRHVLQGDHHGPLPLRINVSLLPSGLYGVEVYDALSNHRASATVSISR